MTFENPIIIIAACPACHGDGGHEHFTGGYNHHNGEPHTRWSWCETCEGSGSVEEEVQPRTLADLEQEDFDMLEAQASR